MSRKKTAKINLKKSATKPLTKLGESMEKDFRSMPSKIAAHYRKDLANLKQQTKKLAADLKKAQAQQKTAKAKLVALASKSNATAKKQTVNVNKTLKAHTATVSNLSSKLEEVKKLSKIISQKQAKFIALGKELSKIEKQLEEQSKKVKAVKKAKATKKPVVEIIKPETFALDIREEEAIVLPEEESSYSETSDETEKSEF